MLRKTSVLAIICMVLFIIGCGEKTVKDSDQDRTYERVSHYDIVWNELGQSSADSMPVGNGDIGLNVWTEQNGDVVFLIGKSDAWSENNRLLKLGRVRLKMTPNPFTGAEIEQRLDLMAGMVIIRTGGNELRIWPDANAGIVRINGDFEKNVEMSASLEIWRTEERSFKGPEWFSCWTMSGYSPDKWGQPQKIMPDTVIDTPGAVVWCHRNSYSIWPISMRLQGLGDYMDRLEDPLKNRTFGGMITGEGFVKSGEKQLKSASPDAKHEMKVYLHTAQTPTPGMWLAQIKNLAREIDKTSYKKAEKAHKSWWRDFWARSYIFVSGSEEAELVTRGYVLARFVNACAGRGNYAIKFNGSLFNYDNVRQVGNAWKEEDYELDADYRRWGGDYWFQNTRLPYWTMPLAGDFDMMLPLFDMYMDTMELAKIRSEVWFGHGGVFVPETMSFWGTYANGDYGWNREGLAVGHVSNAYIGRYIQGGLELGLLMIDYYDFTGDRRFAEEKMLPWCMEVLRYYKQHYKVDDTGKLRLEPAQALETYQQAVNPAPDIAGLWKITDELLEMPPDIVGKSQRAELNNLRGLIPDLPMRDCEGKKVLAPAGEYGERKNMENPEVYAIFPYRLHTAVRGDLELARETFDCRIQKGTGGWFQDAAQAAMVAKTDEAKDKLLTNLKNTHKGSKFPGFWGPNYDWVPDMDHAGVSMIALQKMLMQYDDDKVLMFGAWPKEWQVVFKLHGPGTSVLRGGYDPLTGPDVQSYGNNELDMQITDPR